MRILEVNTVAGWGSTGKIAEQIGEEAIGRGHRVWLGYGREPNRSQLPARRIGSQPDMIGHGLATRLLDRHGLASRRATAGFLQWAEREVKPDLVHLHNIHGYYLNYPLLFERLRRWRVPVVWTLHDCWSMTGHCSHFEYHNCSRWMSQCSNCPAKADYPASLIDGSRRNFEAKRRAWADMPGLTIVAVSDWLADIVRRSPLMARQRVEVIKNGIDLHTFSPSAEPGAFDRPYILGVASVWDARKGLDDFTRLRETIDRNTRIVLVGLTDRQIASLPDGITGIRRTADANELARLYSGATCFVNPTYEDTYPTTNLEAQACGTPVVTYRTGGSPESLTPQTGIVVPKGDVGALTQAIARAAGLSRPACRQQAEACFDKSVAFSRYVDLYEQLHKGV